MTSPSDIKYNLGIVNFIKLAIIGHQRKFQGRVPLEIWLHTRTFDEFIYDLKKDYGAPFNALLDNKFIFMQTKIISNPNITYPTMRDCTGLIDLL